MEDILVCNNCEHPIVSTMIFRGAEKFCPSCGAARDLFFGKRVPATKELLAEKNKIDKEFGDIVKDILGQGAMYRNCKICSEKSEYHSLHATQEEKDNHYKALKKLADMKLPC